jgi:hypothetical protein
LGDAVSLCKTQLSQLTIVKYTYIIICLLSSQPYVNLYTIVNLLYCILKLQRYAYKPKWNDKPKEKTGKVATHTFLL